MSETKVTERSIRRRPNHPNMGDPVKIPPGQPKGYELNEDQLANREVIRTVGTSRKRHREMFC